MPIKNRFDHENWLSGLNFYSLSLTNGKNANMWSYKNEDELQEEITEKGVLIVEHGRFDGYRILRIQGNQIVSIENVTATESRKQKKLNAEFQHKLEIVKEIRRKTPSFFTRRVIKRIEATFAERKHIWIDCERGEDIDPLMSTSLEELKSILKKCK